MRIFLTGGTGFLGSHFLAESLALGHEVVALRRPGSLPKISLPREPHWVEHELDQVPIDVIRGCDAFVHLAAQGVSPQRTDWETAFKVNVMQSMKLTQKAEAAGVKRLLFCGTCMEYGSAGNRYAEIPVEAPLEPIGPYATSKAAFTLAITSMANDSNLIWILLRPFHIFGEGQHASNFWPSLRAAAQSGADFPMSMGEQIRDFSPVDQVARKFVEEVSKAGRQPGRIHVANVGSGVPISLADFARQWWGHWNASGTLLIGELPYRGNEIMRFIPKLT